MIDIPILLLKVDWLEKLQADRCILYILFSAGYCYLIFLLFWGFFTCTSCKCWEQFSVTLQPVSYQNKEFDEILFIFPKLIKIVYLVIFTKMFPDIRKVFLKIEIKLYKFFIHFRSWRNLYHVPHGIIPLRS